MTERKAFTIGEVAARTGLSERALRHYEAEGLLKPGRTAAGRRAYGAPDLAALARIRLLKKAGFTVAQIAAVSNGRRELRRLVEAQLDVLKLQQTQLQIAVALLSSVKARLERASSLDAETLCELIRTGERTMQDEQWKQIINRCYTPEEQAHWRRKKEEMAEGAGFDQAAYTKAWEDLSRRIEAVLPMDPKSPEAQGFVGEWNKLLEPFMKIATPEMKQGAGRLWSKMDEWQGEVKSPISPAVWKFMQEAQKAAKP
jgi:DNA-binding transcriptional MerR regulator